MSLIQRIPWRQQPQVATPLNPAFALNGYAAAAPGQSVLRQPTTPVVLGPLGRLWRANGSEESAISGVNLFPDGTPYTIVALAVANGVSGIQMVACADQTPRVFQFRLNDSAAEFISFNTGGGLEVATTSTGAVVAGAPFVMVATATNSKISVFCNGKTASTARSNSTVSNNTGSALEIGGRLSGTYLTGGIYGLVIIPGALSDTQALSLSSNPQAYFSSVFAPLSRRIWAPVSAGGGTSATVTLTGVSATSASGAVTASGAAAVTVGSASAAATVGAVSATGSAVAALTGTSAASSVGVVGATGAASIAIVGAAGASNAGSVSASGAASTSLIGAAGALAVGAVQATGSASAALGSAAASSAAGTVSATAGGGASVTLAGAAATSSAGSVTATGAASAALTGAAAVVAAGTITVSTAGGASVLLSGASATGAAGSITASSGASVVLFGAAAASAAGTVTARIASVTTLIQDLQALLLPLTAGGAWYGANTQEPPTYPYISWVRISSSPNVTLQGPSALQNTRIQIDVFSLSATESKSISSALESAFNGSAITNVPLSSAVQYEDMVRAYRITKDYSVWATN
jgi:hypothetical protein